jgi:DNA-binding MarR family transcriptional regulator
LPDRLLQPHLDRLVEQGDAARENGRLVLTKAGRDGAERLVESRCDQLATLLGDVPADERDQLMAMVHRLAASILAAPAGATLLQPAH